MQNPEYQRELAANSSDEFHKICWVFIAFLGSILQPYQPFETHYPKAVAFIAIIVIYFSSLLAELVLRTNGRNHVIVNKLSLFLGVLAVIFPILIIVPAFGWLVLGIWVCVFGIVICRTYVEIKRDFVDIYEELMDKFGNGNANGQRPNGVLVENQHEHPELPV
ncbi:unnamed protein product [Camellia sinensis]